MKENKENIASTFMDNITIYSEKTKHLFSKEDQYLFENFDKKMPKSSKYLKRQKELVIKGTKEIFKKNPEKPLKLVIIEKLAPMPDFLTAENLLKVVGYITKTWEACQAKITEKVSITVD